LLLQSDFGQSRNEPVIHVVQFPQTQRTHVQRRLLSEQLLSVSQPVIQRLGNVFNLYVCMYVCMYAYVCMYCGVAAVLHSPGHARG
jgi:hypothetical protein